MGQFFGITLLIYIATASVALPIIIGAASIATRDCRIVSGENCVWIVVPASEAPEGQKP